MPSHAERQLLPYTTQQLFDLVIDIERYPEFLPWCRAARILERKEEEFLGELVIAFHHLSENYTSRVTFRRPESDNAPGSIDVVMVRGPFEYLVNRWRFNPVEPANTSSDKKSMSEVDFFLDFKFRSRILEKMIGGLFGKATAKMVSAFKQRANSMYGI
jgi:coenzyme Q-binding protein COQ10